MIVIDDKLDELNNNSPSYTTQVHQLISDVKQLQEVVANINYDIDGLDASVSALDNRIDSNYQSQTNTLLHALETEITELKDLLENQIITDSMIADHAQADRLTVVSDAEVQGDLVTLNTDVENDLTIGNDVNVGNAITAKDIEITNVANIEKAVIDYIEAVTLAIQNFEIYNLDSEVVNAANGYITNIYTNLAEATKIVSHLYTLDSDSEWHSPIGIPDNTELLEITIPEYDGIVTLFDRAKRFSITVLNNSLVTYTETFDKLYRIDVNANAVKVYLDSGSSFQYGVITIGENRTIETTSQIVDKTNYKRNVTSQKGVFGFGIDSENGVKIFAVEELPTEGDGKSIYIVKDDKSYYWTGTSFKPMSLDIDITTGHATTGRIDENLIYPAVQYTIDGEEAFAGTFYDVSLMESDQIPEGAKLLYVDENNNIKFTNSYSLYSGTKYGKKETVDANKAIFENIQWVIPQDYTTIEVPQIGTGSWNVEENVIARYNIDASTFDTDNITVNAIVDGKTVSGKIAYDPDVGAKAVSATIRGTWQPGEQEFIPDENGDIIHFVVGFIDDPTVLQIWFYAIGERGEDDNVGLIGTFDFECTIVASGGSLKLSEFHYKTEAMTVTDESGHEFSVGSQRVQAFVDYKQNAINAILDERSAYNNLVITEVENILSENIDFSEIITLP